MELELSEDQAFFLDTTRRFLETQCPLPVVRSLESSPEGFDRGWWRQGAELGWTSMLVPEADGGGSLSEHGLLDLVLVAEAMGALVSPGPLGPVSVVADAISRLGSPDQRAAVLPGLLSGEGVAAWTGVDPVDATAAGDGLVLTGTAPIVEAGAQADHLLVTVRTADGVGLALVPAGASGLTVTPLRSIDLVRRYAVASFDGVGAEPVGPADGAGVERALQVAAVLQSAETVGVIDRVFHMTVEYLGDRYSFGRPLASYQALKHRIADDKVVLETCAAIATAAARAVAAEAPEAAELVSAAQTWIGPHATELIQDCIQLHGGIGVTWEHDLHLYLRRATVDRVVHGAPDWHAERVATGLLGAAS